MRIAIVAHAAMGGSVFLAVSLARRLAMRGHQVWFVSPGNLPFRSLLQGLPGLSHREIPPPLASEDAIPEDASPFIHTILALHAAERLDVVNVHYTVPWLAYLVPVRRELGVPLVGTFHGTDLYPSDDMEPLQKATLRLARRADALTVVCKCGLEVIGAQHDWIPNFALDPAPEPLPPRDPHKILHISNFRPIKDVPFLVRGFAQMVKQYPDLPARLELIGEGPDKNAVRALIRAAGLGARVRLPGAILDRDKLMREVASSRIVALTSHRECCPLTFLEAMTCGTLSLGPAVGGIPDMLERGQGLLYEPGNLDSLVAAMHRGLTDQAGGEAMVQRAFHYVRVELEPDTIAARYEAVYERVLAARTTAAAGRA